jgi:hypothetical protein
MSETKLLKENSLINDPDASRLIFGLRDTGYEPTTAIADIIDNSIAADATEVKIQILLQTDGRKVVFIGDNGIGMNEDQLYDAMRYGAPRRKQLKSLGKFGLGLKTASSAICKKFSIVSKDANNVELKKLSWDLDHVAQKNIWEMIKEPISNDEKDMFNRLCGETGTLVIWENCDRLLSSDHEEPGGQKERRAIDYRVDKIKEHCGLVFHKFLDSNETSFQNVTIEINDNLVEFWNPFYPQKSEQVLPSQDTKIEIEVEDGTKHKCFVNAWILPHLKDMTKQENKQFARISNRAQGFYIYREGRLIHHGGYLGVFRSGEHHHSLFRVEFDFGYELDDAFKVPVDKSRISFDPALEEELQDVLSGPLREADRRYRRKQSKKVASGISHDDSNKTIGETPNTTKANVDSVDGESQSATVDNNLGQKIKILTKIRDNLDPQNLFVEAVENLENGVLWEPCLNSSSNVNHSTGVRLSKAHDFYTKIYPRGETKYSVEGLDLLLWAFAAAEHNNCNDELKTVWEDIREEVSINLRKLLRHIDLPSGS